MSASAPVPGPAFEALPRERLLPVALETMHVGHLLDRALMPQVVIATQSVAVVDEVAIDEWMGASPVYTGRMRRLMGIEGDGVGQVDTYLEFNANRSFDADADSMRMTSLMPCGSYWTRVM